MIVNMLRSRLAAWCCGLALVAAPAHGQFLNPPNADVMTAPLAARLFQTQVNMAGSGREYRAIPAHDSEISRSVRAALARPVAPCEFLETPLRAVVAEFENQMGVPVRVDMPALNEMGIDVDGAVVTAKVPGGATVRAAWRPILRDCGLTWIVTQDALVVTTSDAAAEELTVVLYPLPRGMGSGDKPTDFQSPIDLIQSTIAPSTWDTTGGPGSIRPLSTSEEPLLVVSQTDDVHDEIESFLRSIHDRSFAEFAAGGPVLRVHPVVAERARLALVEKLKDICNARLGKAGDADATVTAVADTLAVQSTSSEFHDLASQVIAAVADAASPEKGPGLGVGRDAVPAQPEGTPAQPKVEPKGGMGGR